MWCVPVRGTAPYPALGMTAVRAELDLPEVTGTSHRDLLWLCRQPGLAEQGVLVHLCLPATLFPAGTRCQELRNQSWRGMKAPGGAGFWGWDI